MFNKVLVATDMLEACDAAVLTGIEIAKKNNGRFYILHVLESDSTIYRQFVKNFKTGEEIVSNEAYKETVKKEIEKCADQNDVDLIVMGSHTKAKEGKWYVGSAVERVSLRSICPVIVVTDPKALLSVEN